MKHLFIFLLSAFSLTAFAQQKKVAVYVTGPESVEEATRQIVGSELVAAIVLNDEYNAVERTADFLKELNQEHDYQRSGSVDDQQIRELGKQFGVEQVCVANIMPYQEKYYIQARMLDVESATVLATAREISALASIEDIVSTSEKVAIKLVGKKQEEPKVYNKELSTVLLPSDDDCIICVIDNTGSATIVSVKYVAKSNVSVHISPEAYIKDRASDKIYKLTGTNGISTTGKTSFEQGVSQFFLYFEKIPTNLSNIDIVEPEDQGWRWENITLRPYGKPDYYVFADKAEEQYREHLAEQEKHFAEQQEQQERLKQSTENLANSIAGLVNTIRSYSITIYNHKSSAYTAHFGKTVLGVVPANSYATYRVSYDLYGTLTLTQYNGYLLMPTVYTYNVPKQSSNTNLNVHIE